MRFATVLACVGAFCAFASADVLYTTDFEAPTFTAGATLNGQDGWTSSVANSAAVIQTNTVYEGSQAVEITLPAAPTQYWWRPTPFDPIAADMPRIEISTMMRLSSVGAPSGTWGLDVYDNSSPSRAAFLCIGLDNHVYIYDSAVSNLVDCGFTVARDDWFELRMVLDYEANEYYGVVDGTTTPVKPLVGDHVGLHDASIRVSNPGTDRAYFDNFTIVATPEPSPLLLLALTGLLLRRR